MSLFLQPHPHTPTTFRSINDLQPDEVTDFFERFEIAVKDHIDSVGGRRTDALLANDAFVDFALPPSDGNPDDIAAAEQKIAQQLSISRVPRQSGTRAVFVDLKSGILLVGTTVLYNERNATTGVADDSLLHKVDLIQTLLGLNVRSTDEDEDDEEDDGALHDAQGLDTVTLRIGGQILSLREIAQLVAKAKDPHSAFFAVLT